MSGIQIENLVKKYGDNIAVNGLNLNLEKGKVYGFLGPNGAGKSTTMNIITGYIGATSGTVKIDGYDIFKEPEKAKKCVGYLPEIPPLYQDMTVKEYLVFVAELKKIPAKEKMKNIKEVLEMTKTTQVENRLIKNLSKGYKQRVGIAQALIGMPEIIILDEPTSSLDKDNTIKLMAYLHSLAAEKNTGKFKLPMSYTALAQYLSVDRSAMMREIRNLTDEGVLWRDGRNVELLM